MANLIPLSSRILYRDSCCAVVNKLKGEAAEGAAQGMVNLPNELLPVLGANTELAEAVHRLDVPVTGCSLFALTKQSLSFLNAAFAEENSISHPVEKKYWAIVEKPPFCLPECQHKELIHWIQTNSKTNKSFAYDKESRGRRKASLHYSILGEGENYLFLDICLHSGRHHQIRAQLAAAGFHIKGDLKYGAKRSEKGGGIRLHARSISFPSPSNKNKKISVTADPPEIDNLWEMFLSLS